MRVSLLHIATLSYLVLNEIISNINISRFICMHVRGHGFIIDIEESVSVIDDVNRFYLLPFCKTVGRSAWYLVLSQSSEMLSFLQISFFILSEIVESYEHMGCYTVCQVAR